MVYSRRSVFDSGVKKETISLSNRIPDAPPQNDDSNTISDR
jgi:hypothetical protein